MELFPWQQFALRQMLAERADGRWAAFEAALLVPRQNGKGSVIEAYELANLFLFDAQLIIHSAHLFPTAQEAFRRLDGLIQNCAALRAKVRKVSNSHGSEGIELKSGGRIRFMARTVSGAGRGFSPDRLVLDEAFRLPAESVAAVLPSLSAQPNPQILYTSSTGYPDSEVLRRLVDRGRGEGDRSLCYLEHSAAPGADRDDPEAWAVANPSMGYLFDQETVARERATLSDDDFDRERLGLWAAGQSVGVFPAGMWTGCMDAGSAIAGAVSYSVEVAQDRSWSCIAAAGRRPDGAVHVQIAENRPGTDWLLPKLRELVPFDRPVVLSPNSPAGSLIEDIEALGYEVRKVAAGEYAQACGKLFDLVTQGGVRHLGQPELNAAVGGAQKRPSGDAWMFDRRKTEFDISPLAAVTLAAWAALSDEGGVILW